MKQNISLNERSIEILLGIGIIGAGLYFQSFLGIIGVVPIMTAFLGWCSPYDLLGISTFKTCE